MYPRNSAVLFARLELLQRRESPFPCTLVRIPHKSDGIQLPPPCRGHRLSFGALPSNPTPKLEAPFFMLFRHLAMALARLELFQCRESLFPGVTDQQSPIKPNRFQAPPALNRQSIFSISLIDDPRTQIERPFSMPPRDPTVLFARLELFQCRESLFPGVTDQQSPIKPNRFQAPPALNRQSIFSISLIDDPRTQ